MKSGNKRLFQRAVSGFGHRIEDIHRLVQPAALFLGGGKDLAQRCPEAERPVTDGQFRVLGQPAALEVKQELAPALRAFAEAVRHAEELFVAVFVGPDDDQNTLFVGKTIPRIVF